MMYTVVQAVRHRMPFIWDAVESLNEKLFSIRFGRRLSRSYKALPVVVEGLTYRMLDEGDCAEMMRFFGCQPAEAFRFFHPHGFDGRSVRDKLRSRAFITLGVFDGERLVGYGFLRSFFNGKAFRGKIVDSSCRGKGIAKNICRVLSDLSENMGLRQYGTISKENLASMGSSKAVNDIEVLREMENGDVLIQYRPKKGAEILNSK